MLSKSAYAKRAEWRKVHQALQAEGYRLTVVSRTDSKRQTAWNLGRGRGPGGGEHLWEAAEVEQQLDRLARENARGNDVYITPICPDCFYLVLDDLPEEAAVQLANPVPALVQRSSEDNYQAVVILSGVDTEAARQAQVRLNRQLGGDPGAANAGQPFRLAAFKNQKPGRDGAWTRIIQAEHRIDRELSAQLTDSPPRPTRDDQQVDAPASGEAGEQYQRRFRAVRQAVERLSMEPDNSTIDYYVCASYAEDGQSSADIAERLLAGSPDLGSRHPRSPQDYATRTAVKATARPGPARSGIMRMARSIDPDAFFSAARRRRGACST
jgi:hypothetical protein